jgi:hypothetical protein
VYNTIASSLTVDGCPFQSQLNSLNISEGSTATLVAITCNRSVSWSVRTINGDGVVVTGVYPPGYGNNQSDIISVEEVTLANGSLISTITITTSDMRFNRSEIAATVYTPFAVQSNVATLQIQGKIW